MGKLLLAAVFWLASITTVLSEVLLVDGDTLDLNGIRMRIDGIDAPEFGQRCGNWACGKPALQQFSSVIGGRIVTCDPHGRDGYGRTIATCFVDGADF